MGSGTQALIVALIAATLTGAPALLWAVVRAKRTGAAEEDDLVSRAATQAVAAMDTTLKAAVRERKAIIDKMDEMDRELGRCRVRIRQLEGVIRANGIDLPAVSP